MSAPCSAAPRPSRRRPLLATFSAARAVILVALVLTLVAVPGAQAKSLTGDRVLAVLESVSDKAKYSQLFKSLADRGFQITFKDPSTSPALFEFGIRTHDHALLLAPTKPLKGDLSPQSLVSFMRAGGNLLVALSAGTTDSHKDFVYELGIDVADSTSNVRDLFQADPSDPTLLAANGFTGEEALVPASMSQAGAAPVVYKGIAHAIVPEAKHNIVFPILSASPTVTGAKTSEGAANKLQLVSGVQGTNGARAVVVGSVDMLTDEFFAKQVKINKPLPPHLSTSTSYPTSANKAFATELLKWALHEKSVVRIPRFSHHKLGETQQLDMYRIKDTLVVNVTLQEYHDDHWQPYLVPASSSSPIYFSAKMLDPYIRQPMSLVFTTATTATYSLSTTLPDTYGVFTLAIDHVRVGLSPVHHDELVSIRPFRHNEYPRWLPVAMPYYVASVSQMFASVVLVGLWITRKHVPAAASGADKKADDKVVDEPKPVVADGKVAAASASAPVADRGDGDASPVVGAGGKAQRRKRKN
ncbi:Dolichyl-diphosphooligosaccharide--protein glycosyltransferase subunit WBP1 [Catenaria anguillulae PL171]|uniref:Dolichyl-diphosphooligosaccharide--protein glycosyltransferase subunit WBP1 n=1 Tax=Catenaria anguillulae PL171 TaxID=765915 RepID=A0A1Y2H9P6_9FUNG|nr:Dolichyl-diphosphooligosaccharide--protein glycosyltransferase subunit WBP1 [Catenaria anguillulae PL171]